MNRRRTWSSLVSALCLSAAVAASAQPAPPPEPLPVVQVFVFLAQKPATATREDYLRKHAGRAVGGAGSIEAVLPRSYFDTSVPHGNPVVALIQAEPGRKVVCGLPEALDQEGLRRWAEGTAVDFRGSLADAHDWGDWVTVYLGNCRLTAR